MRFTKLSLALLLLSSQAFATWTVVQRKTGSSSGVTTCPVTVTATGTGHLLIYTVATGGNVTLSSVSGAGSWVTCATGGGTTCHNGDATSGWTDGAWNLSSTSGVTTITGTVSGTGNNACTVIEMSNTTTYSFDVSGNILDAVNCTACTGVALTLTGTNDAIVQWSSCGGTCSGAVTNYTATYITGDGVYDRINTNVGTAPSIPMTSSHMAVGAVSFKETSVATKNCTLTLLGAGPC